MMLNDSVVKSMKEQMIPSDDIIESLLAKISEIDNSSESEAFRVEQPEIKEFRYRAKKPVYGYVASVAAACVVIVSCFSIFGDGSDPEKVRDSVEKIIDNPTVITRPIDENRNSEENIDSNTSNPQENAYKEENSDKKSEKKSWKEKLGLVKSENKNNNIAENENKKESAQSDEKSENENTETEITEPKNIEASIPVQEQLPDTWTKEILAEDEVSNVKIQGNNYVVGDTAKVMTSSKISKISLDVEYEDETYNVEAMTKEIANVSPSFAVAMTSNDIGGTVVYFNRDYNPGTLGQFFTDIGFESKFSISQAKLVDNRVGFAPVSSVSGADAMAELKELINSNADAPSVKSYSQEAPYLFMVSPKTKNAVGVEIALEISSNGLLKVKVKDDSTYVFDIGEKAANSFIENI